MESLENRTTSESAAGEESDEGGGRREENDIGRMTPVVRWVSSRTMRQAWVRGEVLQKRISESDTDKFLPPPSDDSQLLMVGRHMSLFTKLDEATLRARSFLLLAKAKNQPKRRANRGSARRERNQGHPLPLSEAMVRPSTLSIEDNDLKFVSQAGTTQIKASFDLQKMVDSEGTDL
jgi:hypothetical protein